MKSSPNGNSGAASARVWLRRLHRWFGLAALLFVLLLSVTGIALNHASAWRLDQRYVSWSWLLDAYGIEAPAPAASFADGDHRATLLGTRLYVDSRELARDIETLSGLVQTKRFVVVATGEEVFILTAAGELVDRLSVVDVLNGKISAIGVVDSQVVLRGDGDSYGFDKDLLELRSLTGKDAPHARWSEASPVPLPERELLEERYRGRGLAVERLLVDLHSGRIVTRLGTYVMDAAAILLILLSLTGVVMWLQSMRNGNNGRRNTTRG